ncbi:maleylpyruvate isomerase family mycothiol-dependent enzyme [Prauserella sp. PE36]|uniref:Maleylpyruvate isomerase family mycothiol-dependent enzyme n=1 Tax=Prauserella endophytica TaxID=1592324 RepID=A0ABY2RVR0_9PSEU|nr:MULTISPECIES: maleylpyruvate isomerase family mycothiol-dependent enzyme [Prauserella]RBM16457.1 maleylpyruvate isomerase family mycothiol-dependent enzyme [Prauserella sp. PE36]TKG62573.1 maleylpyruvate isomerase family mycothiol-dependent enzyme [Prauserella endophytica]
MDVASWISALDEAGTRLADTAERTGLDADVPPCPGWRVRDVLRHTGGVHRWATTFVATGRTEPLPLANAEDIVDELPGDEELVPWFRDGHAALVAALRAAPEDLQCWTFLKAASPLAHWARRQAHETTVHRVDVESAAGAVTPVDPGLAADGVDELLACFGVRSRRLRLDPPRTLHVHATDTGDHWTARISTERAVVTRAEPEDSADSTVRGPAELLYLSLWNRAPLRGLEVTGDDTVVEKWPQIHAIRW